MRIEKFPFHDEKDSAVITCRHICDNGAPILYVSHDSEDGMWQFLCGGAHKMDEARLVSLEEIYALDHGVGELKDMACGCCAVRKSRHEQWHIQK